MSITLPRRVDRNRLFFRWWNAGILLATLFAIRAIAIASAAVLIEQRRYDIPALPFPLALSRYSEESGVDVLLRGAMDGQRITRPVTGTRSAAEALAILLDGSGLVARFTSARSAVILPRSEAATLDARPRSHTAAGHLLIALDAMQVTAPHVIGATVDNRRAFAETVAGRIRDLLLDGAALKGNQPTVIRIDVRIDSGGALRAVHVVRGGSDRDITARIVGLLEGAQLGMTPPPGLPQPLLFDVTGR